MTASLSVRNRQRALRVNTRLLRRISRTLLIDLLDQQQFELDILLVGRPEITRLNETFLRHGGPTDVITFDYADSNRPEVLAGEVFVCLTEAVRQAQRFRTSWPSELARYVIHGILHLRGFDDQDAAARKVMKQMENRLLAELALRFHLQKLGGHWPLELPGSRA